MKLLLRHAYFSLGNNTSHKIALRNGFKNIFSECQGPYGTALREERYSIGFGKRKHLFACYKKFIVPMTCGGQNGVTKLFSPLMKATKQAFVFFSITILIYNSREFIQTPRGGSLSATSKLTKNP